MSSKLIIILLTVVSLIGCTTMRPMDTRQADLHEELETDDHLVIYEKSGRIVDMTFIEMDGDRIRGRLRDGSLGSITVAISDIEKMEIEKIDGAKTTLAVVGGTIVILPLAAIAALVGVMGYQ